MRQKVHTCLSFFVCMLDVVAIDERKMLKDVINMRDNRQGEKADIRITRALNEYSKAFESNSKAIVLYIKF